MSLRIVLLAVVATAVAGFSFAYFQTRAQQRALGNELQGRAEALSGSLQDRIESDLKPLNQAAISKILLQVQNRENLHGVAVFDDQGGAIAQTPSFAAQWNHLPPAVIQATAENGGRGQYLHSAGDYLYMYAVPLHHGPSVVGAIAVAFDANYIRADMSRAWRVAFWNVFTEIIIVLLILAAIRASVARPLARTAQWMRELRRGGAVPPPVPLPKDDLLAPLAEETQRLMQTLHAARAAAHREARLRDSGLSEWTPERLRVHVYNKLQGSPVFVVSNREPYSHVRNGKSVDVVVPASGLVTALEPVLRATNGTWIAHGSGDADRRTVDANDRLRVPPDDPQYTLRRVWLSDEENDGYYYGFANEGLWPLCHIAHTRPQFRASDWEQYQAVNRKFASALLREMEGTVNPCVLIQDYHYALLPRMVKSVRPDARVAIFWHIPWPNPQAFSICPWQRELLDGLLGADLIGFHIETHCNHFLATVDAALESRIDWDHSTVIRGGQRSRVRPYPISVEFHEPPEEGSTAENVQAACDDRAALMRELGVRTLLLGVGVDRVDYTKGILERLAGVERFFEKYPIYLRQFTFVQVGAPSRTRIGRYRDLMTEVEETTERINRRYGSQDWKPIVLLNHQHSRRDVERLYRAADMCLVTSLDDGMNLVAKEYVAARTDEQGVLILSRFTGAARELRDALIVNPYDTDSIAEALRTAIEMDPDERQARMQHMRQMVREQNVYRWAGTLIADLADLRSEPAPVPVIAPPTAIIHQRQSRAASS